MKKLDKLVIGRSKWGRGMLRRPDGLMCCLGIYCLSAGYSESDIQNRYDNPVTDSVSCAGGCAAPEHAFPFSTKDLMETNDSTDISEFERELKLTCDFALRGVEVTFVDGDEGSEKQK